MADDVNNSMQQLNRLEAALERIAQLATAKPAGSPPLAEISARLDSMIGEIRDALGDNTAPT
jgi:hypothetical protein